MFVLAEQPLKQYPISIFAVKNGATLNFIFSTPSAEF